jgi:phosphatidylserine/phosphatidylglycerophosphate/cardiolipin synthase-like enzyme
VPTATPASATPDHYTPKRGVTFNSPVGSSSVQTAIYRKIMRSINSTPKGAEITMFTWNFFSPAAKDALLRAQKRGVRVRVLMSEGNTDAVPNPSWWALKRGLQSGNKGRKKTRHSWARTCNHSCRGKTGSAHSKFFMFSKVGKARNVVIQGSANLTAASVTNQWNDAFTHRNNKDVYDFFMHVFEQSKSDQAVKQQYLRKNFGKFSLMVFPDIGPNSPDPVMQLLRKVRCTGATNTANGHTVLRIAPDVLRNNRGMRLATKIRSLWNNGCNIEVGYTIVGIDIGHMLRDPSGRGPVPMHHLVQDFNGDGDFDNYFHLKSMSIRGNFNGDRSGTVVLNGSANWSGLAGVSDENLGIYRNPKTVIRYEKHLSYWFHYGGFSGRPLIFGRGKDAVYENGRPVVTDGGSDPFAKIATD